MPQGNSYKKENKKLFHRLERHGFQITLTQGQHYKVTAPTGELYVAANSSSDYRAIRNFTAWCYRQGLPRATGEKSKQRPVLTNNYS
jgi:hypothetical protein